jgi:hypothetical protein
MLLTPADEAFIALCKELRALGATVVESGERKATFSGLAGRPTPAGREPPVDELERFPRRGR